MNEYQNTVLPTPTYIQSNEAEKFNSPSNPPTLFNFPAESQVERSSRGLALILRDKKSQVLQKRLIPVFKPFSPNSPKTPISAFLPGHSQATPSAVPFSTPGRPSFPTLPVTPLPAPRDTEEASYLSGLAGQCHSHSHHPGPFNTNQRCWTQPKGLRRWEWHPNQNPSRLPGWKDHTQQDVHTPTTGASLPTQASHRHPSHVLRYSREPLSGAPCCFHLQTKTRLFSTQLT